MQRTRRLMCVLAAAIATVGPPAAFAQAVLEPPEIAGVSQAELDQMLAPIALYPDVLLSQILMASTWPLDVVEAARWSRERPGLEGEAAVAAARDQPWDESVKALLAFPDLIQRMDEDLDWTRRLGEAFLADEERVADTVQALRHQAQLAGYPADDSPVRVHREREIIYIEPAVERVIHVPWYDTRVIYGGWRWPAYPPVYWAPFRWHGINVVHAPRRFYWGIGIHVAPTFYFSAFDWHRRNVVIVDQHRHIGKPPGHWRYRDAPRWKDVRGPRRFAGPRPVPPNFRDRGPRRFEGPRHERPGRQRFDGSPSARPGAEHRPRWQAGTRPDRRVERPERRPPVAGNQARPGAPAAGGPGARTGTWSPQRPDNIRRGDTQRGAIERRFGERRFSERPRAGPRADTATRGARAPDRRSTLRPDAGQPRTPSPARAPTSPPRTFSTNSPPRRAASGATRAGPPPRATAPGPTRSAAPPSPPRAFSHGRAERGGGGPRGGRQEGARRGGDRR